MCLTLKINHSINEIKNAAYSNLQNQAFCGLVQSTFISALPLSTEDKASPKISKALKNYCSDALESLGSYSLLEYAIAKESNNSKRSLLLDMKEICDYVAREAAMDIATEAVYREPLKVAKITPEIVREKLSSPFKARVFSKDYIATLIERQKYLQKLLKKVDKNSQDYKDIRAEMKLNKISASEIMKIREKYNLSESEKDFDIGSLLSIGFLGMPGYCGNLRYNEYISDNMSVLEAAGDDINEEDEEDTPVDEDLLIDDDEEMSEEMEEDDGESKKKILAGKTLEEIAIDSRLSDSDYKKLAIRAETIDIPEIAEAINKKVVDAINREKESYQDIDDANEKLKNALIENDDNSIEDEEEAEEAVTRILDKNFRKMDQIKEHKSLFSKLQMDATEMAMCTESFSITSDLLKEVTYSDTLSVFKTPEKTLSNAIESALNFTMANESTNPMIAEKAIKIGTMAAAIILTFIETLNTLNLYKMSQNEVKAAVDRAPIMDETPGAVLDSINCKARDAVESQKRNIMSAKKTNALEDASYKLSLLAKDLSRAIEGGINIDKSIMNEINDLREVAASKVQRMDDSYIPASEAVIGVSKRAQDTNIVNSNTVAKYISKRPTDHIFFRIASENTVAIECFKNNKFVYGSTLKLEPVSEAVSVEKYIDNLVKTSDLGKISYLGNKPKMTVINKGQRTDI